ncbi:MAG: SUMF1/EgtB/PvdO family nonheme iron enzyme [Planctomycetota bacterium]|nr:SUMF1/EgtB/PvdO family nonheme iron enzyme [Planctomycetota bacterium]
MLAATVQADVFNLGGVRDPLTGTWTGLASLETVPVGDPGNPGELSGASAGGYGPGRICGAVAYTYNIGKFEVTAGQYTEFLNAVAATDTYGLYNTRMASDGWGSECNIQRSGSPGSYKYSVAPESANRPVNYVWWGDAARFANWLNNGQLKGEQDLNTTEDGAYFLNGATSEAGQVLVTRKANAKWALPTEDEWYKAAYYKGGANAGYWDYATGNDSPPGRDMNDISGNNANYGSRLMLPPFPNSTTAVGEFQDSASPYGTFDQSGNVWEWDEAIMYGSYRGLRGGDFWDPFIYASYRNYNTDPLFENNNIGFRVVQVPEPATLSLLALGGLAALRRRQPV